MKKMHLIRYRNRKNVIKSSVSLHNTPGGEIILATLAPLRSIGWSTRFWKLSWHWQEDFRADINIKLLHFRIWSNSTILWLFLNDYCSPTWSVLYAFPTESSPLDFHLSHNFCTTLDMFRGYDVVYQILKIFRVLVGRGYPEPHNPPESNIYTLSNLPLKIIYENIDENFQATFSKTPSPITHNFFYTPHFWYGMPPIS